MGPLDDHAYTVLSAVVLSMMIGIPLGIIASRSEAWVAGSCWFCDTAQTFPSFIYLIPAIMLFRVNDVAVVFSILIFAMVPLTRYTIEGLRNVPPEMIEASDMAGATRWQKLWSRRNCRWRCRPWLSGSIRRSCSPFSW